MTRRASLGSITLAAVLGALIVVPSTGAADVKIFPASFCQPKQTDSPHRFLYNYSFDQGVLWMEAPEVPEGGGESPGGVDITCPILRENQTNIDGFKFSAWVSDFWSEGTEDRVTCSVGIRMSNLSGRLDWETRATPVGAQGVFKLDWGTSLSTGAADAIYFMDCFIPVYSALASYRTDEP